MPWLSGISVVLLVIGLVWGLMLAPPDYQMGDNYRIIYIHVTTATLALNAYVLMAVMAAAVLIWNIKMADMVAKAIAPIGAVLTAIALSTGSLWGIPTWGTWWIWDARSTSTLILLFLYVGLIALRAAYESSASAAKACAVLTLVGVVNIPIIKYSVEWWYTLHQPASELSMRADGANPPEIWIPAFFTGFAIFGLFLLVTIMRTRNEILIRERRASWVQEIFNKGER